MADIVNWQTSPDRRAVIDHAVQILAGGGLVAFPTDAAYAVAGNVLIPEAVERLRKLAGDSALTLALPTAGHALDWAPTMSLLGRRLARRCWPGPVRLVTGDGLDQGLAVRLPEVVRQWVSPEGALSLYVPGHEAITEALFLLPAPLALASLAGAAGASADAVRQAAGEAVDLIVDDGPGASPGELSAVRVNGQDWSMLAEGAITAADIARKTTCMILFVCTGNTCRSPMAEALCGKLLAERLQCTPQELPQRGYLILSAGLAAMPGDPAAREAIEVMQDFGADLTSHTSRPLSADLVLQADYLLTMTRGHQAALVARFARYAPRPRLLDPAGGDVADPVGADREVYRDCACQLRQHLERFLAELPLAAETRA